KHRVGYKNYQYNFLYNHLLSSSSDFWQQEQTHSAEQQLALLGFVGVPVSDKPKSRLVINERALKSLEEKFNAKVQRVKDAKFFFNQSAFALIHPTAAFASKQWATESFARIAEFLKEKSLNSVAIAMPKEREVLENLKQNSHVPIQIFDDLTLPEITALASKAKIFIGNDSGIAHIAAAVETPTVVIFGSSNIHHWRPWTNAANEIVYSGEEFDKSESIKKITVENVIEAIEKILPKI
ncbi:MAG: glycosyltransferase family 9 protein, partial [Acidobacteria bacterium]|nr:glycosyltransferase family 9 protein [Acidobacteriota bacterium]